MNSNGGTMKKQTNTGKFIIIALLILAVSLFALYQYLGKPNNLAVYEGTIISIAYEGDSPTILVDGKFIHHKDEQPRTVTSFMLSEGTKISKNGGSIKDLAVGNHVRIEGPDSIRKSYPAQADADTVDVLKDQSPNFMIFGEVLKVQPGSGTTILTFLVKGNVTGYGDDTEVYVSIPETAYYPFGIHRGSGMLIPGDKIFALIDGAMAESYPMQASASSVIITEMAEKEN